MCKLSKETFIKVIQKLQKYEKFLDKLQDELHVNILEIEELFIPDEIMSLIFEDVLGTKALDEINDWFYGDGGVDASLKEIEEFYNKIEQC